MCDVKWRRMYDKFPSHENNRAHRDCYWKWNNLQCSIMAAKGTDHHLQRQMQSETERNIALLEWLLDVMLHLASRNLPFRGKTEKLGDVHNGNYLGTLELVSHYDALLKEQSEELNQRNQTYSLFVLRHSKWAHWTVWEKSPSIYSERKRGCHLLQHYLWCHTRHFPHRAKCCAH